MSNAGRVQFRVAMHVALALTGCTGRSVSGLQELTFGFAEAHQRVNEPPSALLQWKCRRRISFRNASLPSEALFDFPVMLALDDTRIAYDKTAADGDDVRFTDAAHNSLPHEVESWDQGAHSLLWVQLARIPSSKEVTHFYMHYEKPGAIFAADATTVWRNSYAAVLHFSDDLANSAAAGSAVDVGTVPSASPFGKGRLFAAPSRVKLHLREARLDNSGSASFWVRSSQDYTAGAGIIYYHNGTNTGNGFGNQPEFHINFTTEGKLQFFAASATAPTSAVTQQTYNDGRWHQVFATWDKAQDSAKIFVGGVLEASSNFSADVTRDAFKTQIRLGGPVLPERHFVGDLDEVRVSHTSRSEDWIETQAHSMADSLLIYGDEQCVPVTTATAVRVVANEKLLRAITIPYQVEGDAVLGEDHDVTGGSVTIPAGRRQAFIPVQIFADEYSEPSEGIVLRLLTPERGLIKNAVHTLEILDRMTPTAPSHPPITLPSNTPSVELNLNATIQQSMGQRHGEIDTVAVTANRGGTVSLRDGALAYEPDPSFFGVETATYTFEDALGARAVGEIPFHVMTPFTWSGAAGDGQWSTAENWCGQVIAGVCGGGAAPAIGSRVIFDGTCTSCDVEIDEDIIVNRITMTAGYNGALVQGASSITVGSGALQMAGGSFVGGSGAINITGYATAHVRVMGGQFVSTSDIFTVRYGIIASPNASFLHNRGRLRLVGDCGCDTGNNAVELHGHALFDFDATRGHGSVLSTHALIVENDLHIELPGFAIVAPSTRVGGNVFYSGTARYYARGDLVFDGTGIQVFEYVSGAMPPGGIVIDKASGAVDLVADLTFAGTGRDLTILRGVLNLNGFNLELPGALSMRPGTSIVRAGGTLTVAGNVLADGAYDEGTVAP